MTGVVREADTETQREGSDGKMETKIGMIPRERQLPPEAKREACDGSLSEPQKEPILPIL